MKTKTNRTNYIRVRALFRINQLTAFGWRIRNSTIGTYSIIVELILGDRRLIVISPL